MMAVAADVNVPAVSMMSSTMIAFLPRTSPTMFMTSLTFGAGRRLSMIARLAPSRLEDAQLLDEDRHREQVVERDVEEALDLAGVEIHRERAIGARRGHEVRDELGRDRRARLGLAILPRVAEVRNDRDDRRR